MRAIIYRTSEVSICVFAFCQNHKSVEGENNRMSSGRRVEWKEREPEREVIGVKKLRMTFGSSMQCSDQVLAPLSPENVGLMASKWEPNRLSFISKNRSIEFFL